MIKTVRDGKNILAIIMQASFRPAGVNFCTPGNFSQQVAFIGHPKGKIIEAHVHNPVHRDVLTTQEVLHIRSGRLRVDFYDLDWKYIKSIILQAGDTIILVSGGHGFEVLDNFGYGFFDAEEFGGKEVVGQDLVLSALVEPLNSGGMNHVVDASV